LDGWVASNAISALALAIAATPMKDDALLFTCLPSSGIAGIFRSYPSA